MTYFKNLPDVYVRSSSYRTNNIDPHVLAKNLFRRIKIREELDDVILGFSQYTVQNNERPDQVAFKHYGNGSYDWIVLLCNNCINLYSEWPMTEDELYKMCVQKYGESRVEDTHHWKSQEIRDQKGRIVVKSGLEVPENWTYRRYDGTMVEKEDLVVPVTNYEYESELNDYKRNIYLLREDYLPDFIEEFQMLVSYLPNEETDPDTQAKRSTSVVEETFTSVKPTYSTNIGLTSNIEFASQQEFSSKEFTTEEMTIGEGQSLADGSTTVTTQTTTDSNTQTTNQYGSSGGY
tara:strand:+ start:14860 stop:15732 length:873 start_codon:yes stop_codon:yes gene_type:complete